MSIQKYEERVREDKLNWHDKAAELDSFQILRQPSDSILGRGKADVKFNYKNDTGYNISLQKYDGSDLTYRIDAKKMIWEADKNTWNLINGRIREWKNDKFDYTTFKNKTLKPLDNNSMPRLELKQIITFDFEAV